MYSTFLLVHSVLRWAVIAAGVVAVVRAWRASSVRELRDFRQRRADGRAFTVLFDLQFLVALILYFLLSPVTTAALHHFGAAMSNNVARFWAVEHPFGMIAGLALAHIGRAKCRRTGSPQQRRRGAIYFSLALLVVLVSVPWPFLPYGRPLL